MPGTNPSAYHRQQYFDEMLQLVHLRLDAYEETLRAADESTIRRADARVMTLEKTMRRRAEDSLRENVVVGLEYTVTAFNLTDFERHCVMMALAPELDGSLGDRYAMLQPGAQRMPSVDFCLKTFTKDISLRSQLAVYRWDVFEELFYIELNTPFICSDLDLLLKLDRRMRAFVCDIESGNPVLKGIAEIEWPWDPLTELIVGQEIPATMASYLQNIQSPRLLYLKGASGCGKKLSARHCCKNLGLPLLRVDMRMLAGRDTEYETLLRKIFRESRLRQSVVCFSHFETILEDGLEALRYSFVKMLNYGSPIIFLLSEKSWHPEFSLGDYTFIEIEVPSPDTTERIALWRSMLDGIAASGITTDGITTDGITTDGITTEGITADPALAVDELAAKFSFTGGQIRGAIDKALLLATGEGRERLDSELIHRACRSQISHKLGERATSIPIRYTWDDLILPPLQKNMLRKACDQVRYSHRVYGEWNFNDKIAYGRGISMLFSGPPGTGKTMGAQVIAGALQLEIYKVDLSAVVSKYIGETEKNLSDVFAEVKKSQSILFFDEADALFGKRSEVKDAHDKYANVETAYLLQKMEEYEGIVILASNFIQNFDEAFKRRIKFVIEFPFPDAFYRLAIWKAVFPERMPRDAGIDYQYLADTFVMTGSSIKNVAVSAAFLAAAENAPVNMNHILAAVLTEMRKIGKTLLKEDLKEYYYIFDQIMLTTSIDSI